jgi:type II secretory pathway pseudopilin PulG
MTCPQCQLPNPVGTSYCARCGTPLQGGPGAPPAAKSGGSRTLITVLIVVGVLLVGCVGVGIIAAIAIPSLLRARVSANESMAIGDIRTVISAEAAYQSANAGYYDTLECLGTPGSCIPGYNGPTFIDPMLASGLDKGGYKRTFHPGAAPTEEGGSQRSPSSISSFAYTAVPVQRNQTGVRGFCGDSSGRICYTLDGSEPPVVDGECSQTCQMLR